MKVRCIERDRKKLEGNCITYGKIYTIIEEVADKRKYIIKCDDGAESMVYKLRFEVVDENTIDYDDSSHPSDMVEEESFSEEEKHNIKKAIQEDVDRAYNKVCEENRNANMVEHPTHYTSHPSGIAPLWYRMY